MPGKGLRRAEALFWRRWVVLYAMAGLLAGLILHLLQALLAQFMSPQTDLLTSLALICGPLYLMLLTAAASIQWLLLRRVMPGISPEWIAATICGTLAAVAMLTPQYWYRHGLLPDVLGMSRSAALELGSPGFLTAAGDPLSTMLTHGYFFAIAAMI